MTFEVITNFDSRIPSWPGNGTPFRLVACHDTEGGTGRAGALGTIQFLIDTPWRGASYHEIWWYHEDTDEFGAIQIVHPHRAAGSIAPQPNVYLPTQWVKDSLGSAWWDPNQGVYAVSIAGRVADVDRYAQNPRFLAHAHLRMLQIQDGLKIDRRAEHFQFQPTTRSDWGLNLTRALGGLTIPAALPAPPVVEETPDEMFRDYLKGAEPVVGTAILRPGSSARDIPAFDPNNYDAHLVGTRGGTEPTQAPAHYWVQGTNITLNDGTVLYPSTRWLFSWSAQSGVFFWHEADVMEIQPLAVPDGLTAAEEAALQAQVAETAAQVAALTSTVEGQTQVIADLKTDLTEAEIAAAEALSRAEAAEETASEANALRAALVEFLN